MNKLSVLMTVYNESEFVEYAIRACLPYVDHLVIVEGAYAESIRRGSSPRSTDGTIDICRKFIDNEKVSYLEANEETDKDQRNVGLKKIKELNPDGWLLIIDGDEVYDEPTLRMVKVAANNMEKSRSLAAYFKSLTFVNDFRHVTEQEFPRLFRITAGAEFVSDNFMEWKDLKAGWFMPYIIKIPYIKYNHYSFCKNISRFEEKKKWWETRFGKPFDYGWHINKDGKIDDKNHHIVEYNGSHPSILFDHPLWK